jgi:SP family general alpha glucoside:H+ symporter-like MFS transporter
MNTEMSEIEPAGSATAARDNIVERQSRDNDMQPQSKGGAPVMRSKADELTVWQSARRHKKVGYIAMAAAFCASLDGYRE